MPHSKSKVNAKEMIKAVVRPTQERQYYLEILLSTLLPVVQMLHEGKIYFIFPTHNTSQLKVLRSSVSPFISFIFLPLSSLFFLDLREKGKKCKKKNVL
jgi:hypothetical protein